MLKRLFLRPLRFGITWLRAWMNPVSAGASVLCLDERGHILLVRPRFAFGWMFPGGAAGRCEPFADAARRELREESGHHGGGDLTLFGIYVHTIAGVTNHIALYRLDGGAIAFRPGLEIAEAAWFALDALPSGTQPAVHRRLAELAGTVARSPYW